MATGRRNKYEEYVKPRFDEILSWLKNGATDKEIAKKLGIAYSSFRNYMNEFLEFSALIKKGRQNPVEEIKAAMFKRATGFSYKEKKEIWENGVKVREEIYTKSALPDPVSGLMLLKHWDHDTEWSQDPAALKLKKEELEIKKKRAESEDWS